MKRLLSLLSLLAFAGFAQGQTWNSNTVTWEASSGCTIAGQPTTPCAAVTSYRIERAATQTGTYSAVGTVAGTVLTFTHANATAGQNCYRVFALTATQTSGPSTLTSASCRTNTAPDPVPNPPTNVRVVETTVFNLWMEGREVTLGQVVGTVPLNTICGRQQMVADNRYRTVARSNVTPAQPRGMVLVARCG